MSQQTIVDVTMMTPDDWYEVPLHDEPGARSWAKRLADELDAPQSSGLAEFLREEQRIMDREPSTVIGLVSVPQPSSGIVDATIAVQMVLGEPGDTIDVYLDETLAELRAGADEQGIRDVEQWRSPHPQGEIAGTSFLFAVPAEQAQSPGAEQLAQQVTVMLFPTGMHEMVELTFASPRTAASDEVIDLVRQLVDELRIVTEAS